MLTHTRISISPLLIFLLFLYGWLDQNALAQSTYKEIAVKDGGTIKGHVFFEGEPWTSEHLTITKDPATCGKAKASPRLKVGKNKGVQSAVIYIEGITEGKNFIAQPTPVLNQKQCEYSPHIMILQRNSNLEIVNSDPILHNVHTYSLASTQRSIFNIAQPIRGQRTTIKEKQFNNVSLLSASCDAGHPWMSAYMMIADHPYYAITDENGAFTLDQIPPGTYKLRMWHEGVSIIRTESEGDKPIKYYFEEPYQDTQDAIVKGNETISVNFKFQLRNLLSESAPGKN